MLIELIGPGAVGKSTIGPILSEIVGIPHYAGQGFYRLNGQRMTTPQLWADRMISVASQPSLLAGAWRVHPGSNRKRLSFALTTCRRERFARRVAAIGSGIFSSGPVHWLCQECTRNQHDMTELVPRIVVVDVYVKLIAPPEVLTSRLAGRGGKTQERIAEHHLWVSRYLHYAETILARLGKPVITVDASGQPDEIAGEIARRITTHLPGDRS